ncbi:MAG TPA: translation elongation factor Ts [Candidatus Nitrosocosmicus sp.]|nr:translation elongation factor Ts [Candidatus Nitrosocosmicus sp.]
MTDIQKLKQLRDETGVSFNLCKKALDESGDDIEKSKSLLQEWGIEKAAGKANRETKQGSLFSYIHHNKKVAVMLELLCETDFVAANENFQKLGNTLAMQIASMNPKDKEELMTQPNIRDPKVTIDTLIKEQILKIGENIMIGRFERWEI